MSDVFISYARSTAAQAKAVAEALRSLGYGVWLDDELPAHRSYADVIDERLRAAKAVVVIWSAEAVKSQWVRAEADLARQSGTLVQLAIDGTVPPLPFNQIQCADLVGWHGDVEASGWRKVVASIADLIGAPSVVTPQVAEPHLPRPSKLSIAVMPFTNLSGERDQENLANGLVEEIIVALSHLKSVSVIASGSSMSLKGKGLSSQEAARQLGVRFFLEGNVRKAADRIRITVTLFEGNHGAQLWADRFEGTLENVFVLQDRVALGVAAKLELTLRKVEHIGVSDHPTDAMGVLDLHLRAFSLYRTFSKTGVVEALDLENRAIGLDPAHGQALAIAALCHQLIVLHSWSDDSESHRRQGIELAHRALKTASDDATVLGAVAVVLAFLERDLSAAMALIDQAITLNQGSMVTWRLSGLLRAMRGETELAMEHLETAMRFNPTGRDRADLASTFGQVRFQQRRFVEAIGHFREFVQQTDSPMGYAFLASSYGHLEQMSEAQQAIQRYRALTPQTFEEQGRSWLHNPTSLKLFLDGIALAEGRDPIGLPRGSAL